MPLISRIFILFVSLAICAGATNVQVIEGDAAGTWDLSAKKLRAMAAVYLAELGYVPSSEIANEGVSFSASGPAARTIQMTKLTANGQVEESSVVIAGMDDADEAVEDLLTKGFNHAPKIYDSERPSEVFFMDPELIDVDEHVSDVATKRMESALEELGYRLSGNRHGVKLQMFLVKLKDAYWLGMIRMEGSKVIKGVHQKFSSDENLQSIVYSLTNKVMAPNVEPKGSNTEVADFADTHEAKCRATESASNASGFFAGLTFDLLCNLSDYLGLEMAAGGKDLYGKRYPNLRFDFVWGFSGNHAWLAGLDYTGTMGQTKSRWAFESVHRFSQRKGIFVDLVWGWGHDREYEGWYMGGDIGYNLLASGSKAHWLSLMLRYDWAFGESLTEGNRISVNLIYDLRGYFSD